MFWGKMNINTYEKFSSVQEVIDRSAIRTIEGLENINNFNTLSIKITGYQDMYVF